MELDLHSGMYVNGLSLSIPIIIIHIELHRAIFLEKLICAQLPKNSAPVKQPESLLRRSQGPSTGPYPGPDKYNAHLSFN